MRNFNEREYWNRLALLIDLSNEIALHNFDYRFSIGAFNQSGDPGELVYVFDESVFEFFIDPDGVRRKYSAQFHTIDWREEDDPLERYWILVNEMIAISTGEQIFKGNMPGQVDGNIYITYWHYNELMKSLAARIKSIAEKPPKDFSQIAKTRTIAKKKIADVLSGQFSSQFMRADEKWPDDYKSAVAALGKVSGKANKPKASQLKPQFRTARHLAQIHAIYKDAFVSDQIRRLQINYRDNVLPIYQRFPLSDDDWSLVNSESRKWRDRLAETDAKRSEARSMPTRHPGGIDRDALSIAYLQHVARFKIRDSKERILFVTGDSLLISTYRQWYADRYLKDPSEPNILRSMRYFNPIWDFGGNQIAQESNEALFNLMQVALNVPLLSLNLSGFDKSTVENPDQKVANLSWHYFEILNAVNSQDPDFSFYGLTLKSSDNENFIKIRNKYQTVERNSLWSSIDHLIERSNEIFGQHENNAELSSEDFAHDYAQSAVIDLITTNVQFTAPFLEESLNNTSASTKISYRAPISLKLDVSSIFDDPSHGVVECIQQVLLGEQKLLDGSLRKAKPYLLFVVQAIAALRTDSWADAFRYSFLAKKAFSHLEWNPSVSSDNQEFYELCYLRSVCSRFMLGNTRPIAMNTSVMPEDGDNQNTIGDVGEETPGDNVWYEYLKRSIDNLKLCIQFHAEQGQDVRLARSYSELAAARFFYAAWGIINENVNLAGYDKYRTYKILSQGIDDLLNAARIIQSVHPLMDESPMQISIFGDVRRQVFANIAAACALVDSTPEITAQVDTTQLNSDRMVEDFRVWVNTDTHKHFPPSVQDEVFYFCRKHCLSTETLLHSPTKNRSVLAIDADISKYLSRVLDI